jgi:hypothetical protein
MNKAAFRKLHRTIAPIIFVPLLLSALTGIGYRIGRSWLAIPRRAGHLLMAVHQGEYLGHALTPVYVLFVGLGLLGAIATGLTLTGWFRGNRSAKAANSLNFRQIHRRLAPLFFIPLALVAMTGIGYSLGESWLGLPEGIADRLMDIHQGSFLGNRLRPIYVLVVGMGLLSLLITGIEMTGMFRKKRQSSM